MGEPEWLGDVVAIGQGWNGKVQVNGKRKRLSNQIARATATRTNEQSMQDGKGQGRMDSQ